QTREALQLEMLRIWRQTGKTVVFITHSIDEAVFLGQRVAVMTAGPGRIKDVVDVHLPPHGPADEADDEVCSPPPPPRAPPPAAGRGPSTGRWCPAASPRGSPRGPRRRLRPSGPAGTIPA